MHLKRDKIPLLQISEKERLDMASTTGSGYYEYSTRIIAKEYPDKLGNSRVMLIEHLRNAENKVIEEIFGRLTWVIIHDPRAYLCKKEIKGSPPSYRMKPGKKKSGRDETNTEIPGSDIVSRDNRDNPDGVDAIRALQIIAVGIAVLVLVWFLLHNILHLI
jgi:hypothetical protein